MHVLTDMETIHQSCHIARVGKIETYQIDLQVDDPPHPPQHSPISEVRADSLAMAIVQAVKLITNGAPISILEGKLQSGGRMGILFASLLQFQSFG
jgi:hypothetical protein